MALFVLGMKCVICSKPIDRPDRVALFRPFVSNECDPLWMFNDRAFHSSCVDEHPFGAKARARQKEVIELGAPSARPCAVCNRIITSPDEFLPLGFFSEAGPLSRYNYLRFHRSCLPRWQDLTRFLNLFRAEVASGGMKGQAIVALLKDLSGGRDEGK